MTYEQHVAEAERLLVKSYGHDGNTSTMMAALYASQAQAHATLAIAVRRGSNLQEPKWYLEDRNTR